jgi:transcriptional regulator of acetoin/glycerol metabolism
VQYRGIWSGVRPEISTPTLDQVVRDHILHVLSLCGNHKTHTAQMLGIDRSTLWKKLREYGVSL